MTDRGSAIILVVERDPHVRALEAYFLTEAGYAVEFATDGVAGLELVHKLRPDILITEVLLPKLDGLSLCRAVKSSGTLKHTLVLVFSILAAHARALEAGADSFLMKPLSDERLVDAVRTLLDMRRPSSVTQLPGGRRMPEAERRPEME